MLVAVTIIIFFVIITNFTMLRVLFALMIPIHSRFCCSHSAWDSAEWKLDVSLFLLLPAGLNILLGFPVLPPSSTLEINQPKLECLGHNCSTPSQTILLEEKRGRKRTQGLS
jgi:hypothetical protein